MICSLPKDGTIVFFFITVILNTNEEPSIKICRGSTHSFQCTTIHHSGYLEWNFIVENEQPISHTFLSDAIKGSMSLLNNNINVTLTSTTMISGIHMFTSTANVPRIVNRMIIKCSEATNDSKQFSVEIEGKQYFHVIYMHGSLFVTLQTHQHSRL